LRTMPLPKNTLNLTLVQEWPVPVGATLGSSVRAHGILLEIRARLPAAVKRRVGIEAGVLVLRMSEGTDDEFRVASSVITSALAGIEDLPVIPREIEDILAISTTERHRWLKDGRLPSAGTRTVRLRGRAKTITFHVFDPRHVEDLLNGDLVAAWREEDAVTAAENRRRAAWKRRLIRAQQKNGAAASEIGGGGGRDDPPTLLGWEEFEREGPLR
jgi:hypothetical protein